MSLKARDKMESGKLASFFEEDLCLFSLRSRKKASVLQEMVRHLKKTGRISDEQFIIEMLKNRESLGSTGLGMGVAFPHGRSLAIQELSVLFGHSSTGIDFEALDSKPVNIFFLILAPSDKGAETYLALLSELIGFIQKPNKLNKLMNVKDFKSLVGILDGKE